MDDPPPVAIDETMSFSLQDAVRLYGIENWGAGYFNVNAAGHLTVHPDRGEKGIDLYSIVSRLKEKAKKGVTLKLDDVPLETAVRLLAEVADLGTVRMNNVLFVTTPERVKELRQDAETIRAMLVPVGGPGEEPKPQMGSLPGPRRLFSAASIFPSRTFTAVAKAGTFAMAPATPQSTVCCSHLHLRQQHLQEMTLAFAATLHWLLTV